MELIKSDKEGNNGENIINEENQRISIRYPFIKKLLILTPEKIGMMGIILLIFDTNKRFFVPCRKIYIGIEIIKTINATIICIL